MSLGRALALLTLVALTACDKKEDPAARSARIAAEREKREAVVARLAPAARAKIARATATEKLVRTAPRAGASDTLPALAPPMRLLELHRKDPASNADVMLENELSLLQRGMVGTCSYYLRHGTEDVTTDLVEDVLTTCAKVQYFLVVRPDQKTVAKMIEGETKYTGGEIAGDVVVFELGDAPVPTVKGVFPISVELTASVKVRQTDTRESKQRALDEALRAAVLATIDKKLGASP